VLAIGRYRNESYYPPDRNIEILSSQSLRQKQIRLPGQRRLRNRVLLFQARDAFKARADPVIVDAVLGALLTRRAPGFGGNCRTGIVLGHRITFQIYRLSSLAASAHASASLKRHEPIFNTRFLLPREAINFSDDMAHHIQRLLLSGCTANAVKSSASGHFTLTFSSSVISPLTPLF
jgi:hypothetical protein